MEPRAVPRGLARARLQSLRAARTRARGADRAGHANTVPHGPRGPLTGCFADGTSRGAAPQRGPGLRPDAPVRSSRAFPVMIVSS
jgi:hypothetical protein